MLKIIFDKANVLTFVGLLTVVIGINLSMQGNTQIASILLVICGICDGFDGIIAKKVRKNNNSRVGIELDSLVDIVSSGIYPMLICLNLGLNSIIDIIIYGIFIICGITRLVYFNTNTDIEPEYFTGIPITSSTIVLPLILLFTRNSWILRILFLFLSMLYISNIKIRKVKTKGKIFISLIGVILILLLYIF